MAWYKRAKVFVHLTRDLKFEAELNNGRMSVDMRKYSVAKISSLQDLVESRTILQILMDELHEFGKANTWSFWIFSSGLDFYISLDYKPTEKEQRYLIDFFTFLGGTKIEITQTGATKDYTDVKGRLSRLIARARPQVKQFFTDDDEL